MSLSSSLEQTLRRVTDGAMREYAAIYQREVTHDRLFLTLFVFDAFYILESFP